MQHFNFYRRVPIGMFLVGLALSGVASLYVLDSIQKKDEYRVTADSNDLSSQFGSLVNIFKYGLGGANGIYAASESVEHDEFAAYVASRNIPVEFPGALGFGFIKYVERSKLDQFVKDTRKDNQPNFTVKSSGSLPDLLITKYIEPEAGSEAALGFDFGSEPTRRAAAEQAMLSGLPTLTKRITLRQESAQQEAGFVYLRPVYLKGMPLTSPEQRRAAIEGWVCVPFTLERVIKPVIDRFGNDFSLSVFEGDNTDPQHLLFSHKKSGAYVAMQRVSKIDVGQQIWTVVVEPLPAFFEQDDSRYLPGSIFLIGFLMSVAAASGAWILLASRERVIASQMREGEKFIEGILDSANFSIIVIDPNGLIRVFNRAASRMLGYSPEEVIGLQTPEIWHDQLEVSARALIVSAELGLQLEPGLEVLIAESRRNLADENEWTFIRKDGSRFPASLSITAMRSDLGEIVGFLGIASDISERKRAEKDLLQSEAKFRSSFDYASHGIALVGMNGQWLKVNHALCLMLGNTEAELLESSYQEITHREDLAKDLQLRSETLEGIIQNYHHEKRYQTVNGKFIWVHQSVSLVRDEQGTAMFFVFQIQDITDRKITEANLTIKTHELLKAKEAAQHAARSKSDFLANMSHEIRTPLTSIIGYSESLITDQLNEQDQRLALETVMKNGHHLLGIINDILDLSKIEAGKLDVELVTVDLAGLISDVANLMQHKAEEKGLALGFQYLFPIPHKISTDPTRLKQILINLVGNAVKFTSVGGVKINISYDAPLNKLEFAVVDTGPGLTTDDKSKLFKAFSQADTSITRRFGGSGLGLVISSELARRLGGEITLESQIGKGSVFTTKIDAGTFAAASLIYGLQKNEHRVLAPVVSPVPKLSGRILVAEDGEDNRGLLTFLLGKTGVDFKIVENGELAVIEATNYDFDLILMDVQMPVMDGYTATKTLRGMGLEIPIVALSANAMKSDIDKAFSVGCSDFLGKPFTRKDLFALLCNHLKSATLEVVPEGNPDNATMQTNLLKHVEPEMLKFAIDFIGKLNLRHQAISEANEAGKWEEVVLLSHSLRGASAILGLEGIAAAAGEVEHSAEDKAISQVSEGMRRLEKYIREATDFVKNNNVETA